MIHCRFQFKERVWSGIVSLTLRFQKFLSKRWLLAASCLILLAVSAGAFVYWRASRALRASEEALSAEQNLRFTVAPYLPAPDTGFEPVSTPALFSEAAEFDGKLYVCGPASLNEYDNRGKLLRQFHVGHELPASPLARLVTATLRDSRTPELLIGTAADGVLAFDGTSFRQILPEARDARSTTALLPLGSGRLLIGNSKRGLLVYDGHRLGPYHPSLSGIQVTELAGSETALWVGTQDRGVAYSTGGTATWFDEASGLPDNRVYSIVLGGDRAYVGTAAGIAEFERGKFVRVLAQGAFVRAMLLSKNKLLAATMEDGILEIPLENSPRSSGKIPLAGSVSGAVQMFESEGSLYAVATGGVYAKSEAGWRRVLEPGSALLTDANISALAVDTPGRLWIGYFDRGVDLLDPRGEHVRHFEDDHLFCINRILPGAKKGVVAVATANGLVLFDEQGNRRQVLTKSDGLISDHVTAIATYRDGMVLATPAGLTFIDNTGARSLYAFHGLVNNHVYAIAAEGRNVMAGTLGGISLLQEDRILKNYTTANSALKHNWITAVLPLDKQWWVGTYGAGVMRMDASGQFEPAAGGEEGMIVNPNAMLATDHLLLAGSMGRGLYVMKRDSGRWMQVTSGLPSRNVTALAAAGGYVYVGTDNGLVRIPEQRLEQ